MTPFRMLCGAFVVFLASACVASADNWPSRSIIAVSTVSAGNAGDTVARVVFEQLSKQLGQSFVIENRTGAGGVTGSASAAHADPDGYTMLLQTSSQGSAIVLHKTLPYDPANDFVPVAMFGVQPSVLVVSPDKGWKTVNDLVKQAQAQPGKMAFASAGVGSATHMNGEKFKVAAKLDILHVPYKGTPEALNDVMGGRVDYFFSPVVSALSIVRDKRLIALAVGSPTRASVLPDVPTTEESGYPGSAYNYWAGLLAPAGTPPAVVERLNKELVAVLALPEVKERLAKVGADPAPMQPKEFDALIKRELVENGELVKAAGIKAQ
jgi:tripartite-type tricarboxylate transporter receptor subunit TctC